MSVTDEFVTPEAVTLETNVAGPGSRILAGMLDGLIQFALILIGSSAAGAVGGDAGLIFGLVVTFVIFFGYPLVLEATVGGRTVGKLAAGIHVERRDGGPPSFAALLVRTLLRLVDFIPAFYAVGMVALIATPRTQRLGDLAAGTVVVYDKSLPFPVPFSLPPDEGRDRMARSVDPAGLSEQEYAVVRSFLLRRASLDPAARERLAADLAGRLRPRVGAHTDASHPEAFLEALVSAYRQRWETGS
jgi:uncharacterized RDD family membrane protein YckC